MPIDKLPVRIDCVTLSSRHQYYTRAMLHMTYTYATAIPPRSCSLFPSVAVIRDERIAPLIAVFSLSFTYGGDGDVKVGSVTVFTRQRCRSMPQSRSLESNFNDCLTVGCSYNCHCLKYHFFDLSNLLGKRGRGREKGMAYINTYLFLFFRLYPLSPFLFLSELNLQPRTSFFG